MISSVDFLSHLFFLLFHNLPTFSSYTDAVCLFSHSVLASWSFGIGYKLCFLLLLFIVYFYDEHLVCLHTFFYPFAPGFTHLLPKRDDNVYLTCTTKRDMDWGYVYN